MYDRDNSLLDLTSNQDLSNQLEEVICLYIVLDDYIKNCGLTDSQHEITKLLMQGFNEVEISNIIERTPPTINGIIKTICKKIFNYNNFLWKYEFIYIDKKKVGFNYKRCSYCEEYKPEIDDFFGKHPETIDGLQSNCKHCNNLMKKGK